MFDLESCARSCVLALRSYRCARDTNKQDTTNTKLLLDANENAFGPPISSKDISASYPGLLALGLDLSTLNRYPDPSQRNLKQLLCNYRNNTQSAQPLTPENVFLGVSSDEPLDALIRCFCTPSQDSILICPPTYALYEKFALANDIRTHRISLTAAPAFQLNVSEIKAQLLSDPKIKLIHVASPGNPTGSLLKKSDLIKLLDFPHWNGVLVIDEAYIDFAEGEGGEEASMASLVTQYPNLVVVHTFSKAFGMASIRIGAAFSSPPIVALMNGIRAPYNISATSSALASYCLSPPGLAIMQRNLSLMKIQRKRLIEAIPKIEGMGRIRSGNDANFVMLEVLNGKGNPCNQVATKVYDVLVEKGLVCRYRGGEEGCRGCLRVTVGTEEQVGLFLRGLEEARREVRGGKKGGELLVAKL